MIEIPEWYNASVLVDRNLEAGRADKVAIYCGEDQVSYGELARRINRFGHALREMGVDREERVLLLLNDTPAFPTAFFAAMRIGAVPIPTNTLLQPRDYRFFVENSRARVVVCDQMHHATVREALEGYEEEPVEVIVADGREEDAHAMEDLLEAGEDVLEVAEEDVCFSASKLFHAYGLGNNISFPYWAGSSTVLFPGRPTPQAILETIEHYRPSLFFSVPTLYNAILNYKNANNYDLSSIRMCASAAEALPAGMWRRWKETFGSTILDGIGSTEMLHIFISNTPDELKPGSSDKPF